MSSLSTANVVGLPASTSMDASMDASTGMAKRTGISIPSDTLLKASASDMARYITLIQNSGARWLRVDWNWWLAQDTEGAGYKWGTTASMPGGGFDAVVALCNAAVPKIKILGIIGVSPPWSSGLAYPWGPPDTTAHWTALTSFVTAAVTRYAPQGIHTWEVWNEPKQSLYWGNTPSTHPVDPAGYTTLLKKCYKAIKAADSTAVVVSAGLAPMPDSLPDSLSPLTFLKGVYAAGGQPYFNAVGMHPYCYRYGPDDPGLGQTPPFNQWYNLPAVYALMTKNGDGAKKIWATEFGAPSSQSGSPPNPFVTEAVQASTYVTDCLNRWNNGTSDFVGAVNLGKIFMYEAVDAGTTTTDPQQNFGLYRTDGGSPAVWTAKPAFAAFQAAMRPSAGLRFATIGSGNLPNPATAYASNSGTTITKHATDAQVLGTIGAPGDRIFFTAGTYTRWEIQVQANQTFVGQGNTPGSVVFDGTFTTGAGGRRAFYDDVGVGGVTIANLTVKHYTGGAGAGYAVDGSSVTDISSGAIDCSVIYTGSPTHTASPSHTWTVDYVDCLFNRMAGVHIGDFFTVKNSRLNHNGVEGYESISAGATLDNCEVAWNNTPDARQAPGDGTNNATSNREWGCGGGKLTGGRGNVVTHCEFHNNDGTDMWDDVYCGGTFTFNYCHDSNLNGIQHEIGYDAVITDNLLVNCGKAFFNPITGQTSPGLATYDNNQTVVQGAGVFWSDSKGGDGTYGDLGANGWVVQRNTITGCVNGIMMLQANRSPNLTDCKVGGSAGNGNVLTNSGHSGWYAVSAPTATGITMDYNSYTGCGSFVWNISIGTTFTFAQLQASPRLQELHGSFV